ncbi:MULTISPECIES: YcfL family protein [Pseudoalteromonas]|uniref:YcfL family protein n=1 Tax=Pseudoalteromonas TaxID=53246 RepID=UPI0007837187|nr:MULTISPECIES: YcfL family protein [Gammaproteobacteria]MCF7519304.1 YcfL family protein [Pseudoalteromonas sp. L21]UJX26934.1 YcfL family protein [Pseudoalteromonas sp. CF6-2]|tara:strand:- start:2165 stop:2590 length:426 start_codon:yes stop_codon:yes gene_type:complete
MKHILPLLMILLVTACSSRPTTSGIGVEQTGQQYNQQLIIDNPELAKKLAITDVKTRQTNGLTDVVVTLASQYKKSQYLQYQFTWYDADGFMIRGNHSPWQAIKLFGFAKTQLPGLAPTANAVTFSLAVREVSTEAQEFED